jgi:hypothetical protein
MSILAARLNSLLKNAIWSASRLPSSAGAKAPKQKNEQLVGPTKVVPLLQSASFEHFSASCEAVPLLQSMQVVAYYRHLHWVRRTEKRV